MAPEILKGQPATPLSDLFSLSVTLWESLAGERLFHAKSEAEIVDRIRRCDVQQLTGKRRDVPARLAAAIHRGLSGEPSARFGSAREMATSISNVLRESDWGDADGIVANAVAQARASLHHLPHGG